MPILLFFLFFHWSRGNCDFFLCDGGNLLSAQGATLRALGWSQKRTCGMTTTTTTMIMGTATTNPRAQKETSWIAWSFFALLFFPFVPVCFCARYRLGASPSLVPLSWPLVIGPPVCPLLDRRELVRAAFRCRGRRWRAMCPRWGPRQRPRYESGISRGHTGRRGSCRASGVMTAAAGNTRGHLDCRRTGRWGHNTGGPDSRTGRPWARTASRSWAASTRCS